MKIWPTRPAWLVDIERPKNLLEATAEESQFGRLKRLQYEAFGTSHKVHNDSASYKEQAACRRM